MATLREMVQQWQDTNTKAQGWEREKIRAYLRNLGFALGDGWMLSDYVASATVGGRTAGVIVNHPDLPRAARLEWDSIAQAVKLTDEETGGKMARERNTVFNPLGQDIIAAMMPKKRPWIHFVLDVLGGK